MSTGDEPEPEYPAWFRPPSSSAPSDTAPTVDDDTDAMGDMDDVPVAGPASSGWVDDGQDEPLPGPERRPDLDDPRADHEHDIHGEGPAHEPVDIPDPPVTGDDAIDVALSELADVTGSSLEDQLAGYEQAHRVLQDRLADVEG